MSTFVYLRSNFFLSNIYVVTRCLFSVVYVVYVSGPHDDDRLCVIVCVLKQLVGLQLLMAPYFKAIIDPVMEPDELVKPAFLAEIID